MFIAFCCTKSPDPEESDCYCLKERCEFWVPTKVHMTQKITYGCGLVKKDKLT